MHSFTLYFLQFFFYKLEINSQYFIAENEAKVRRKRNLAQLSSIILAISWKKR